MQYPERMRILSKDPDHEESRAILTKLSQSLLRITGDSGASSFQNDDVRQPRAVFVIGYENSEPIACGALRPVSKDISEIKRMYAENGTGVLILEDLEKRAVAMGYAKIWLSTRVVNERAVRFYEKNGYCRVSNYGKYRGREISVCYEKILK